MCQDPSVSHKLTPRCRMIRIHTLKQELGNYVKPLPQRNWKVGSFICSWRWGGRGECFRAHLKTASLLMTLPWDSACKPHGCQSQACQVPSPGAAVTTAQVPEVYKRSFQGNAGDLDLSLKSQRRKQGGNAPESSTPLYSGKLTTIP